MNHFLIKSPSSPTSIQREEPSSAEIVNNHSSNKSEIIKTNNLLNAMHPLETKLKCLIDSYEISKSFAVFIEDINSIRYFDF